MREAHVPAEHPQTSEDARLPRPHADTGRSGRHHGPTATRPQPLVGLIRPIRDRATFAALARAPRHRRGPVTVRFVPGPGAESPRVAYTTARANAVVRNRIRRRLRAAVTRQEAGLLPDGAYLFGAGAVAATAPFPTLVEAVGELARDVAEET
jgi:ribonuclease P protein component